MFDKAIKKVYNYVTAVIKKHMNGKDRFDSLDRAKARKRYTVRPKKRKRLSKKKRLRPKTIGFLKRVPKRRNLSYKTPVKKRKTVPSLKYILPLLLSFIVVFGVALVFSLTRAEETAVVASEEKPTKIITIHYGREKYEVLMTSGTVMDAIKKAGLEIDDDDKIVPSAYTNIESIDEAWVIKVSTKIIEKIVDVDFETFESETSELQEGSTQVVSEGEKGAKLIRLKLTYKNGLLVSQVKLDDEIIKRPIDRVVKTGIAKYDTDSSD